MKLTTIKTFDHYFNAHIILTRLKAEGIECYLFDENTVTVNPILGGVIGGIKLAVDEKDTGIALKTLRSFEEEYLQSVQCPKCGENDILLVPKQGVSNIFTTVLTWMFSNYAISLENIYQCQKCGFESKALPENKEAFN